MKKSVLQKKKGILRVIKIYNVSNTKTLAVIWHGRPKLLISKIVKIIINLYLPN